MITDGIDGGVVHALPNDWRDALVTNPTALHLWDDIITPRTQRMDLLDHISKKTRYKRATH